MGSNTCDCPKPPGGTVQCNEDQIAICRVKNGVPQMACISPPAALLRIEGKKASVALQAWISTAVITGRGRVPLATRGMFRKTPTLKLDVLSSGEFTNPRTGEVVTFRLPALVKKRLGIEESPTYFTTS